MKHGFISSMAALLATAALAGCSSSDEGTEPGKVDRDQTRYLSVAVNSPTASRADFEDGAPAESDIKTLYFVFYDGTGAPVFDYQPTNTTTSGSTDPNVTKIWSSVIPVRLTAGQNLPSYVMCFVNPINGNNLKTMTLTEIEPEVRDRVRAADGSFPMSNSVYYGNDPISHRQGVRLMETPISELQLFKTEDEANAALTSGTGIIDIYVERYAAKIGLSLQPSKIEAYAVNGYTLKFEPEYWRPNAIDQQIYVTKAFGLNPVADRGRFDPTQTPTKQQMEDAFRDSGMAATWNDESNRRCYWACSPSYFTNSYPKVSDNITDTRTGFEHTYSLKYYSYNEISGEDAALKGLAWNPTTGFSTDATVDTDNGYFYSRETTTAIEAINDVDDGNPKAAVASVVIVGRYRLTKAGETTPKEAQDFYLYGRENNKWNLYETEAELKEKMIANQRWIFTDEGQTLATAPEFFEIKHPEAGVRNPDEAVAGRLVALQLKTTQTTDLYYYDGTGYVVIDDKNIEKANRLLWQGGSAQMYKGGLAFFSVPIHHLGWNDTRCYKEGQTDWEHLKRGDLGVVRNHVYNIEVTKISGLGTGLRYEDQPIVPPMDDVEYSIAARLNVLAWKIVPTQKVEL